MRRDQQSNLFTHFDAPLADRSEASGRHLDAIENVGRAKPKPLRPLAAKEPAHATKPDPSATVRERAIPRFLSVKDVALRYVVSVPTIWRWVAKGRDFPHPIKIAQSTTRWAIADLEAYDVLLRVGDRS